MLCARPFRPREKMDRITAGACEGKIAKRAWKSRSERHEVARIAAIGPRAHEEFSNAIGDCSDGEQVADLAFAVAKRLSDLSDTTGRLFLTR